jgi:hypothetical protein
MHWKRWQWLMAKAYLSAIQDAVVSTSRLSPEDVVMRLSVHMNYVDYEIAAHGQDEVGVMPHGGPNSLVLKN